MNTDKHKKIIVVFLAGLLSSPFFFYSRWQDVDFWGHLFFGKQIVETKTIPKTDCYSYTAFGNKWIDHEWLSEIVFYFIYKKASDKGLIFLKITVGFFTSIFLFLTLLNYSQNYRIVLPLYLFSLSLIYLGASFRPQIFSYLYLAITGFLIHSYIKTQNIKSLYALLVILILWANSHGGFIVGVILSVLILTDLSIKKHLLYLIMIPLVTLINPYHIGLWKTVFAALTNPLTPKYIGEWSAFNIADFSIFGYVFVFLSVISVSVFILLIAQKRYLSALIVILTIVLSYRSVRHIPIGAIIIAPFLIPFFQSIRKKFTYLIITAFSLLPFLLILFLSIQNPSLKILSENKFPEGTMKFITEKNLSGNIYNEFNWGEYLIWNLYPQCKVAIDGRYDTVYPIAFLKNFFEKFEIPENTDFLLLKPSRIVDIKKWRVIYTDMFSIFYKKST
ncbi:MAG: hypothetical protein AB1349_03070 [Elusimicrobiota bacterium]